MRRAVLWLAVSTLFLAGCDYEVPLTEEHSIKIDSSVLGLWEIVSENGEPSTSGDRLTILKYSDTEYLIHYPVGEDGIYYRGYSIRVGDITCVQTQVIGDSDGPAGDDDKNLYGVVIYILANGELEIKTLNKELISKELKDSEALRNAFLKHQKNEDLFIDPSVFKRVENNN